jgi:drug/metabolite transporter (DMT)-like permease
VPLYAVAAVISIVLCFLFANPIRPYPPSDILWMTCLGIVPTVFGHSILNRSMHVMRGQLVSVMASGQFIFAAIMAWLIFAEVPPMILYPASALFLAGGWLVSVAKTD